VNINKALIKILQRSVFTQTVFDGLSIRYPLVINFL